MFLWPHARPCSTQLIASCLSLGIISFFLANEACGCNKSVANDNARPIVTKLFLTRIYGSPVIEATVARVESREWTGKQELPAHLSLVIAGSEFSVLSSQQKLAICQAGQAEHLGTD